MDAANEVIRDTVREAVDGCQQPETVATLIINWYEQVMAGNESILTGSVANKQNAFQHLERIFEEMRYSEETL